MIGQALGDLVAWTSEHVWHIAAGIVVWTVAATALAVLLGRAIALAEWEEPGESVPQQRSAP